MLLKDGSFEVREYAPHVVAKTLRLCVIRVHGLNKLILSISRRYKHGCKRKAIKQQVRSWARYNPPFTLWFLRRNEVLIPITRLSEQARDSVFIQMGFNHDLYASQFGIKSWLLTMAYTGTEQCIVDAIFYYR
ncbi:heme-binding protein [Oceanisphaera profunda]|uniref:heme-binding protein n=1 Tax=Oceanisphaera profunda TaxID=1416627 RepID=UPI001D13087B|nr:heme-binding protein [Oceanisphaera profunda]